jgi:spermidine synthase
MVSLRRAAPLLFLSGACGLIYETVWLRELRLIFGSSTFASAGVTAIYIGGLGLGAALLGRRADEHPSPLRLYGNLELLVAGTAAVTPLLLWVVRHGYVLFGGLGGLGVVLATIVRLVLATLILAAPTVMLGGTLPAAVRAVEVDEDERRAGAGLLYGLNTLGAVAGTALSTFWLLETLGNRGTLFAAAAVSAGVGLLARRLGRFDVPVKKRAKAEAPASTGAPASTAAAPPRLVFAAAALVGFAFFTMELVWYRMLAPLLGGSTYSFGCILAVALLGVGAGGAAYAALGRSRPATVGGFALTCALEAALVALPLALGDQVPLLALGLRFLQMFGFTGLAWSWVATTAVVALGPAFVAGVQFPLLVGLLGRGRAGVGRDLGTAYAWNTTGSIAGAVLGGFVLLPAAGAVATWRASAVLLAALALAAALWQGRRSARWAPSLAPVAAVVLAVVLAFAEGPTAAWRHSGVGAGRAGPALDPNGVKHWLGLYRRGIVWERDGRESSVAIKEGEGISFLVNGKSDGSALLDASTQVMSGLLGAMLHPSPKAALVIGLGTGETAGWLGKISGIDRVDVVEIEPAIEEVARRCAPVNERVLENPKVHVVYEDAREVLLTSRARYDIIFSEPSNPYRAGIASLFTREFYRAVKERLSSQGLLVQWIQAYEVDPRTVQALAATLLDVFPQVELWHTNGLDMLVVARAETGPYSAQRLREAAQSTPYREALARTWGVTGAEGVLSRFVGDTAFVKALAAGTAAVNTDDRNLVEFSFARALGTHNRFAVSSAWLLARRAGQDKLALDGPVDWSAVEAARWRSFPALSTMPLDLPVEAIQMSQIARDMDARNFDAAYALLKQDARLRHPADLEMAAYVLALKNDPQAEQVLKQVEKFDPVGAGVLRALQLTGAGDLPHAADALVAAFERHRTDPWTQDWILDAAFQVAGSIAAHDAVQGRRVYDGLAQPFAVKSADERRLKTRVRLAGTVDAKALCSGAFAVYEPNPIWERGFLEERAKCYALAGDPRSAAAQADLDAYDRDASPPLENLVKVTPAKEATR